MGAFSTHMEMARTAWAIWDNLFVRGGRLFRGPGGKWVLDVMGRVEFSGRVFVAGKCFLVDRAAAAPTANRYLKVYFDGVTAPEFLLNSYDMTTAMPYNYEVYDLSNTSGDIHVPRSG